MNIPQIDLASNVTDFYGFIQITILFVHVSFSPQCDYNVTREDPDTNN